MDNRWLRMENLQVNLLGRPVLRNISLEIRQGEQWVFFGEAGAGKTVLAHTLAGQHVFHGLLEFPEQMNIPLEKITLVVEQQHRFRDLQNQSNFYYQQRFNSFDAEATVTVRQDLEIFEENAKGSFSKSALLETFHLYSLLDEPLIQLSNGENKRIQILKAILQTPYLLILDEPFTGLDQDGRQLLNMILEKLSALGQHMILFTSRDHAPSCFNRQGWLEQGNLHFSKTERNIHPSGMANRLPAENPFPSAILFQYPDFRYAVRMNQVNIRYEGKTILDDIHWVVEKGSRWALTGPNGAGKSTLLSLITADNPQAYANDIYLFDRKRGSGESIWEIKQKTGFLSPELQLYFEPSSTAFSALASGLFDTIGLFRQLSSLQEQLVWEWLDFLDCRLLAYRLLSGLPAGIQRLILLARALIKTPPLLILDEPCQGLDTYQTEFTKQIIDRYCRYYGCTLIYVSHYSGDFPPGIDHTLRLQQGKIV